MSNTVANPETKPGVEFISSFPAALAAKFNKTANDFSVHMGSPGTARDCRPLIMPAERRFGMLEGIVERL